MLQLQPALWIVAFPPLEPLQPVEFPELIELIQKISEGGGTPPHGWVGGWSQKSEEIPEPGAFQASLRRWPRVESNVCTSIKASCMCSLVFYRLPEGYGW